MVLLLLVTLPIAIEIAAWIGEDLLQTGLLSNSCLPECDGLDLSQSDTAISL